MAYLLQHTLYVKYNPTIVHSGSLIRGYYISKKAPEIPVPPSHDCKNRQHVHNLCPRDTLISRGETGGQMALSAIRSFSCRKYIILLVIDVSS